jgi:PKD repeat protein
VNPSHSYATAAIYTVSLTVTDNSGLTNTAGTTADIAPAPVAPTADPNGPYSGTVGSAVTFDGSGSSDGDGTIVSYAWDFGDGSTAGSGVNPSHSYATAAIYTVSLTVTDNSGLTNTAGTTADIQMGPDTLPCDLDEDGDVDADDRNIFLSSYRLCTGDAGYLPEADSDNDGCITLNDYREWYKCYKDNL